MLIWVYDVFFILTLHPYDFTLKNFPGLYHFIGFAENQGQNLSN